MDQWNYDLMETRFPGFVSGKLLCTHVFINNFINVKLTNMYTLMSRTLKGRHNMHVYVTSGGYMYILHLYCIRYIYIFRFQ